MATDHEKLKKSEEKITKLEERITKKDAALAEQKETITVLRSELKELKNPVFNAEERKRIEENLKDKIDQSNTDFTFDGSIETIKFKQNNDTFIGRHVTTIYKNEDDLKGQEFQDAVTNDELQILHVFIDIKEGVMNFIESTVDIDKAILKNHNTKRTMKIVCNGKNESKQLTFNCTEL